MVTTTTAATNKPTRAEKTAALLERMREGVATVTSGEDWRRMLALQARFHRYSFGNVMLILAQMPRATRVAGFHRWKDLGRSVRKGEKGIAILAPVMRKSAPAAGEVDDDDDADVAAEEGGRRRMGFRVAYVFDVGQTDGEPLPAVSRMLEGGDEPAARAAFELLLAFARDKLRVPVTIEKTPAGVNGFLSRLERRIVVGDHLPPVHAAKTLAHEIAHAVLHLDAGDSHERPVMEVEAESTAFVVLDALGFDTSAYSFGYVANWSDGKPEAVTQAGQNVARAARLVLDAIIPEPVVADDVDLKASHA